MIHTDRTPILCPDSYRLLAEVEDGAIWLWCKACKEEHRVMLEELLRDTKQHPLAHGERQEDAV